VKEWGCSLPRELEESMTHVAQASPALADLLVLLACATVLTWYRLLHPQFVEWWKQQEKT